MAQSLDLDALSLKLTASLPQRLGSDAATSHRVLGEGALVEEDAGMTPPDGQKLPLAVCGLEWPVLCLQRCNLLFGGLALVLTEHGLP